MVFYLLQVLMVGVVSPPQSGGCLATTICSMKERMRDHWSPTQCSEYAAAFQNASLATNVSVPMLVATALNESALKPVLANKKRKAGRLLSVDVGVMGVHCNLKHGVCVNDHIKGMTVTQLSVPRTNILVGAMILSTLRDEPVYLNKGRRCQHRQHPYWAHYNWGNREFRTATAAGYPQRVAALIAAVAGVLGQSSPELLSLGEPPQGYLEPHGWWQKELYGVVLAATGVCDQPLASE